MSTTVANLIHCMELLAPAHLAETWDNVGLQVGRRDWPVKSVIVALDPLPEVVEDASRRGADLLITHHPLIFKPLKTIDFSTPTGRIIDMASRHQLAVFCAHTNLDSASRGLNDILAETIGLKNLSVLGESRDPADVKLVLYVPADHEETVLNALMKTNTGIIGKYSQCTFRVPGTGTFKPGKGTDPHTGKSGMLSQVSEVRIETVVRKHDVRSVIDYVRRMHPYETMAFDVYPLSEPQEARLGIGRIGDLPECMPLAVFARQVGDRLGLGRVKIAGNSNCSVSRVAVCSGSGSGLIDRFLSSEAEVYVSGDIRYHEARTIEAAGRGVIDVGHFASEHIVVNSLVDRLTQLVNERKLNVRVEASTAEKDPFITL